MSPKAAKALRRYLLFALIVLLAHVVSHLLYIAILAAPVGHLLRYSNGKHVTVVILFSFFLLFIFMLCNAVAFARNGEERRGYLKLTKDNRWSVWQNLKYLYKDALLRTLIYLIFQIPFAAFYSVYGFSYSPITGFERTYIFDVGFYELTGSAILGFLLNGIVFFAGILLLMLLVLFRWEKERI